VTDKELELERKRMEIKRIEMARLEMEFKIKERLCEVSRLNGFIENQKLKEAELRAELEELSHVGL
jgi:hypothetical protein